MEELKLIIIQPNEVELFKGLKLKDGSFLDPIQLDDGTFFITDKCVPLIARANSANLESRPQKRQKDVKFKEDDIINP